MLFLRAPRELCGKGFEFQRKGLPFAVAIPNAQTRQAIDDALTGKDLHKAESVDALSRDFCFIYLTDFVIILYSIIQIDTVEPTKKRSGRNPKAMNLSPEDTELFYKLMWSLQFYISRQGGLLKKITTLEEYGNLPMEQKHKTREMLWDNPKLIDAYLQANPQGFSSTELEIVRKWKAFVKESFFILRHLKKYSIFIGNNHQVYAVLGLRSPLEELIPSYALPAIAEAILLPFKGVIIFDGMFSTHNLSIGGGIRANLNHVYTVAKQKDRIITTLEPEFATPKSAAPKRTNDLLPKLEAVAAQMSALKGETPLQNAAILHARTSLELAISINQEPEDFSKIKPAHRKLNRASTRLNNLLEIEEYE